MLAGEWIFAVCFSEFLGWGLEHAAESQPNSFPNFYGDRPVPIGQEWSDDRFPLNEADSSVIFSMKLQLTANFQKKKCCLSVEITYFLPFFIRMFPNRAGD